VAAVVEPVSNLTPGSETHRRVRFGNVEPALLALLKQLDPLIAALTYIACELLYGEHLTPAMGAVAVLTFIIAGRVFGQVFPPTEVNGARLLTSFYRIVVGWFFVVAILLFAAFAFKVSAHFSRLVVVTWFGVTPLVLAGAHVIRRNVGDSLLNSYYAPRYIIIGVNTVGYELLRRMPQKGFMGFFDFRSADRVAELIDADQLAGHCKDVAEFARMHGVKTIYIALPLSNVPRIGEMIRELRDTTASIYFVPDVFAFELIQGRLVEINGIPAISVCETPFQGMDAVLKRATDIVLGVMALIVLMPLMLGIALAVKLTSPGPVLFRQRRYGLNGEEILVYKFRSMKVCEDGEVVTQATKQDTRVTPLGRFLRRTSLDELPQLLNVLEGKMSVVGPRPHAVAHNELYRKLISGYMIRHKVRPGITGLAQVNGLRGETEIVEKMSERVKYDLEYLRHWSPWLDVKIILKTVMVLIRDRNVY
jgi:putative colanic acid biosysnthesis UDP-glucose lipid carrier transferase